MRCLPRMRDTGTTTTTTVQTTVLVVQAPY